MGTTGRWQLGRGVAEQVKMVFSVLADSDRRGQRGSRNHSLKVNSLVLQLSNAFAEACRGGEHGLRRGKTLAVGWRSTVALLVLGSGRKQSCSRGT